MLNHGGCSSMVEHLTVDQEVAGSSPVIHPKKTPNGVFFLYIISLRAIQIGKLSVITTPS